MKIEIVSKRRSMVGEGPHWDGLGNLWHVDVTAGDICKLNPRTQETDVMNIGGFASLVIPYSSDPTNHLLISKDRQLRSVRWGSPEDGVILAEPETGNTRFNDGKCDETGRLWAGTMGLETAPAVLEVGQGSLYSIGKDLQIKCHVEKISISNGLAWTKDNKTMFYIDSLARNVTAFDFDLDQGSISNRRVVHQLEPTDGFPDGMCIDTRDQIWVACFAGSKVISVDPTTGKRTSTIKLPTSQITSCCFGGEDYHELYVTSANVEVPGETLSNEAGAVFRVSGLGVKGLKPNNFCG